MRRATLLLLALALALPGMAGAQQVVGGFGLHYTPAPGTIPPGTNLTTTATYGANIAPAIAAANWTCGAGWDCSVAGTLNKNADGVGTAVPNPALTITAGVTYKVVITVGAVTVASGATYTLGGTPGTALTAAATYTDYITAATTANLIITPTPTATRFTVTAVTVEPMTDATGDATVDGNLTVRSPSYFKGPMHLSGGTAAYPAIGYDAARVGFYFDASSIYWSVLGSVRGQLGAGYISLAGTGGSIYVNNDTFLVRDAANAWAMRNSTNAQTFNIYNTYTDASNYERGTITADTTNGLTIATAAAGSGTNRNIRLLPGSGQVKLAGNITPDAADARSIGSLSASDSFQGGYFSRTIAGSKSATLTESSATTTWDCAVAAGSYLAGELTYAVYAADATDQQVRKARVNVTAANKAGTTTCNVTTQSGSTGADVDETHDGNSAVLTAGTLTYEITCVDTTDSFAIQIAAVSSLTQTSLVSLSRWDQLTLKACTPQ